jgi:hypothetical protein
MTKTRPFYGQVISRSRSRNHRIEIAWQPDGDELIVTDISKSGEHNCRLYKVKGAHLVVMRQANPWDPPCPVCYENETEVNVK